MPKTTNHKTAALTPWDGAVLIPLEDLVLCDFNVNEMDPPEFAALLEEVRDGGFDEPGQVIPITEGESEGKFLLLGGEHRKNVCVALEMTHMPCFPAGTPIATPKGLVNIDDVRIGDVVFNRLGQPTKVANLSCRAFTGDMVRVIGRKGVNFESTDTHGIFINSSGSDPEKVQAKYLQPKDEIVTPTFSWPVDELLADSVSNNLAWLIGLYAAEGCPIRKGGAKGGEVVGAIWTLHEDEVEFRDRITAIIRETWDKQVFAYPKKGTRGISIRVHDATVGLFFDKHCGAAAANKHLPWGLMGDKDKALSMFNGCFDGDGYTNKYYRVFRSVSPNLAMQMYQIGLRLSVAPSIYTKTPQGRRKRAFTVQWSSGKTEKRLPQGVAPVTGISLRQVVNEPVFNIEVDDVTHSYVIGAFCAAVANCVIKEHLSGVDEDTLMQWSVRRNNIRGKINTQRFAELQKRVSGRGKVSAEAAQRRMLIRKERHAHLKERFSQEVIDTMVEVEREKLGDGSSKSRVPSETVNVGTSPDKRQPPKDEDEDDDGIVTQPGKGKKKAFADQRALLTSLKAFQTDVLQQSADTCTQGYLYFGIAGHTHLVVNETAHLNKLVGELVEACKANSDQINEFLISAIKKELPAWL